MRQQCGSRGSADPSALDDSIDGGATPRGLFVDATYGIAGDMLLAALFDWGVPEAIVREPLEAILPPFSLEVRQESRRGIAAKRVTVTSEETHSPHRTLPQILEIIDNEALSPWVREQAAATFRHLAEAEGAVHGCSPEEVHFHEVGAIDSLVDIIGCVLAIDAVGAEEIRFSSLPLGSGQVKAAHGVYPIPAPATLRLLAGLPTHPYPVGREVTTPTGAVLAKTLGTLSDSHGAPPPARIERIGVGSGTQRAAEHEPPNLIRVWSYAASPSARIERERVLVLETNVDHLAGEDLGHALERLLAAGALDAFAIPTTQKKSRPGSLLTVLATPESAARLEECLFAWTGTLGVRQYETSRRALRRRTTLLEAEGHEIRVKWAEHPSGEWIPRPEFDDIRLLAEASGRSIAEVRGEIVRRAEAAPPAPQNGADGPDADRPDADCPEDLEVGPDE